MKSKVSNGEINHPAAVRLIQTLLEYIPIKTKGTYNRADPTHYEKGELEIEIVPGLKYKLSFHDCTWGIELEIEKSLNNGWTWIESREIYLTSDCPGPYYLVPRSTWVPRSYILAARILKHLRASGATNWAEWRENYARMEQQEPGPRMYM